MKSLLWRNLSPTALQIAFMVISLAVAGLFIYFGVVSQELAKVAFFLFAGAFLFSAINCVFFILKGPSKKNDSKENEEEPSKRYKVCAIVNVALFAVEATLVTAGIILIAVM